MPSFSVSAPHHARPYVPPRRRYRAFSAFPAPPNSPGQLSLVCITDDPVSRQCFPLYALPYTVTYDASYVRAADYCIPFHMLELVIAPRIPMYISTTEGMTLVLSYFFFSPVMFTSNHRRSLGVPYSCLANGATASSVLDYTTVSYVGNCGSNSI